MSQASLLIRALFSVRIHSLIIEGVNKSIGRAGLTTCLARTRMPNHMGTHSLISHVRAISTIKTIYGTHNKKNVIHFLLFIVPMHKRYEMTGKNNNPARLNAEEKFLMSCKLLYNPPSHPSAILRIQ